MTLPNGFSTNPILFGEMHKLVANPDCTIIDMLLNGVLTFEGRIDTGNLINTKKRSLWAYLYYLWTHNRELTPFKAEPDEKTLKELVVKGDAIYVSKFDLANYINLVVDTYEKTIQIVIINKLLTRLEEKVTREDAVIQKALESIGNVDLQKRVVHGAVKGETDLVVNVKTI